jgi:IclR family transcriptional regulator, pca regulon regulatory protein
LHLGARLPAHATSTGQVLLASRSIAERQSWFNGKNLPRITPLTCVDEADFLALLERVRQQDHALARDTHEVGIHALAVPLRNLQGQTVAALNVVSTPSHMSSAAIQHRWLPLLHQAAQDAKELL